ncbi:MAG: HAD family hydrolase [Nitrospiraceae bacterium]|nr:HAD family hydrolase [Nitrospiraceae bacterium]
MLDTVIFDLDDTLVLEIDYVRSGYRAVGQWAAKKWHESPEDVEQELWRLFCTGDRSKVISEWLGASGRDNFIEAAISEYRKHIPHLSLVPGASEVLQNLLEHFKLGLVTDGYSATQRRKIEALNLESLISVIVISDEIDGRSTWKPSPIPFLEACARLDTTPDHAVYVGDNPHKDFLGARTAGLTSVRLRLDAGIHSKCEAQDEDGQPDRVVEDFCQIPDALHSLSLNVGRAATLGRKARKARKAAGVGR